MDNRVLLLIGFLGLGSVAFAQKPSDASKSGKDSSTLQEVIVSATRKANNWRLLPYSSEIVRTPMNDFRNARTTPEALSYTPGVFVQKTNHGGGSPFVRGLTGNQTLLLLDGVRINNSTFRFGPNQYPNLIDPYTIERLEVVKGSGSVQYGSDAMGGVIQIITQQNDFNDQPIWYLKAGGRVTSQDMEYTNRAEAGYSNRKVAINAGVTWRKFGDLYGGDTTGKQRPTGYDEKSWNIKVRAQLSNRLDLTVNSQKLQQQAVPLFHRVKLENFEYYLFDPQQMNINYARLNWKGKSHLLQNISFTGIYKQSKEARKYHKNGNTSYFNEKDVVESWGATLDVFSEINNWWSATSGIEFYHDLVKSSRVTTTNGVAVSSRGLYPNKAEQDNFSVFSLHHFKWHAFTIEAGIRYNTLRNHLPAEIAQIPGQPKPESITQTPSSIVGNASLLYKLATKHAVYASLSNGYRAPGIDDMGTLGLVDFRYEIPAYDLKPEKNTNTEIGYRYFSKKLNVNATLFYMHISDVISRVRKGTEMVQGYPVYIKTNDQQSFIRGFELSGDYRWDAHWLISGFISNQFGQNLTRHEPMRRIPPVNGLITLTYKKHQWYTAAEVQWAARQARLAQGDKDDNRIPKGGTPNWQVFNVHGGWQGVHLNIRASLNNLLNEDYRTHGSGVNGMGRAATLSVMYKM